MKKILKETDPRFVQLERKVGFFIIISLLLGVVLFIGVERDLLTPKYTLYFTAEKGRGLSEGMPVKLSGFNIGKVKSIFLDELGRVKVELSINKKYIKWINRDSVAWLIKEGLFGSYIIEISPGSSKSPPIENRDTLDFDKQKELEDVIEELKPTLGQIKGMISYVNDPQGDIKVTINNLRQLSGQLFTTKENLDNLLKNANKGVVNTSADLKALSEELGQTAKNLNLATTTVNKDLPKIMSDISKSAENIEKLSSELRTKLPSAIDDTKEILEGAKKSWPINTMVAPPQQKPPKGDSFE